ncbi:MAG TPA: histone deacetylase family protein, partial [Acidimicrobiales bacterium]|nr:histone deacetylase family protein [Acidimicrobiales bacterium]
HRRHDPHTEIQTGEPIVPIESPARAEAIRKTLEADDAFQLTLPTRHGMAPLAAVHDGDYLAFLAQAWDDWAAALPDQRQAIPDSFPNAALRAGMGPTRPPAGGVARLSYYAFDTATVLVPGTYAAARAAADVALTAADLVLGGEPAAYALCRPPGHHAPRAAFGGYCFLNNAAIAAEHTRRAGADRVAVLDVDYHHGNGTQQIFYERPDVLCVSLHGDPDRAYPYFAGYADECGAGFGLGATVNLPLPERCDDDTFLAELDRGLDAVDDFDPDIVVVSLGVDSFGDDPLCDLAVTAEAFHPCGLAVSALDCPLVIVQEGGYAVDVMGRLVQQFLRGSVRLPPG